MDQEDQQTPANVDAAQGDLEAPNEDLKPRERILKASLELFVKKGYFNTNVPDISKLSRCSVGSIYHHFLNKEEIASQLYQDGIEQFREALGEAIDPDVELESAIKHLVVAFLSFAESHHTLSRYLWLSRHNEFLSVKVAKPTVVGFDKLGRRVTKLVKNGARSGTIPDIKAEIFWSIVFGVPLSFIRDWLEGYTSQSPTEAAPTIAEACWAGLHGLVKA